MPLVVDASVALAWALPDESSPYADAVLAVVEQEGLRVPELWAWEIANGLAVAYLRKRITSTDEKAFLAAALSHLSIEVEDTSPLTVVRDGTAEAMRYGLTAYDAAYVDLASRERLTLASSRRAIRKAAEQSGVTILAVRTDLCAVMHGHRNRSASRSSRMPPVFHKG